MTNRFKVITLDSVQEESTRSFRKTPRKDVEEELRRNLKIKCISLFRLSSGSGCTMGLAIGN